MGQQCCAEPAPQDEQKSEEEVIRFFMVGTGGAGKTTVIRQLKCLCKDRPKNYKCFNSAWEQLSTEDIFSRTELDQFKRRVKNNILTAVYNLIEQAHEWRLPISAAESAGRIREAKEHIDMIAADGGGEQEFEDSLADDIVKLLNDESIVKTLKRSHEMSSQYRIVDGTFHFLPEQQIRRIFDSSTEMTSLDIVHSRYPTKDIQDFRFGIKQMRLQIHDMGGQTSELVKLPHFVQQWIRSKDVLSRNFILYVTSMPDFNLVDEHSEQFTAMDRSLRTLDIILGMSAVSDCGVLIFFNKLDRFDEMCTEMLKSEKGRKEILKYLGSEFDNSTKEKVNKGTIELRKLHKAVMDKFSPIVKKRTAGGTRGVYMRLTSAIDAEMMSTIFNAIEAQFINNIISSGEYIMG